MALHLEDKKALVAEVAEVAAKAQSVVAAEYRGLSSIACLLHAGRSRFNLPNPSLAFPGQVFVNCMFSAPRTAES